MTTRRPGAGRSRRPIVQGSRYFDPLVALGFTRAWRADECTDNGSVTLTWENYLGSPLSLPRQGTGQPVKAVSANLGGRYAVAFNSTVALGAYGNVVALGGAPTDFTMVSILRVVGSCGWSALTTGGTANTGVSQLSTAVVNSRKVASNAASTVAPTANIIQVTVATAAGVTDYTNRYTGTTAAIAGALAGTSLHIGGIDSANGFNLNGEFALFGYATRALTAAEVGVVLTQFGRRYGITIAA